jgi:serine/threonine-protein kinase
VSGRGRPRILPTSGSIPTFAVAGLVFFAVLLLGVSPSLNPVSVLTGQGFDVDVPDVVGQTQPRALLQLEAVPLDGRVTFAYSSDVPRGIVVSQVPREGARIRRDKTVRLIVSRGPNRVTVPSVVGEPVSQARRDLRRMGLRSKVERLNDEVVPKGQVVRQNPGKDVVLSGGERVDLVVSLGPFVRTVPELAGTASEGALFTIGKTGLALGTVTTADDANVPEGAVIATNPPAGTQLPRDTPIDVVLSNGPPPVAVPGLVGGKQSNAVDQLARLGLVAGEISAFGVPDDPGDGTILDQSPEPGTPVRRGQVVTLTVRRAAIATTTTAPPVVPPAPGGP